MNKIKLVAIIFAIISVAVLCFFIIWSIILSTWKAGGEFINYPPSNISLTAEYLYNNPSSPTHEIGVSRNHVNNFDELCVAFRESATGGPYMIWSKWFLNGALIPLELYSIDMATSLNRKPLISYCLELAGDTLLLSGIHLFEIHLQNGPFDSGISYQWAIKIEPSPTPSQTPSTP
jgi:hypothetical protein